MLPAVEINNLSFAYHASQEVLKGVSFSIAARENVALIGPNGAGKSTLLWHLNGLLPERWATERPVKIMGEAVEPESLPFVRQKVGLLFQDPNDQIFNATVFDDVAFGPAQLGLEDWELKMRVREALVKVGLIGFENREPHHLSGGEKRRVCVAGVLACRPEVLVMDEPSSNLDPRARRQLIEILRRLPVAKLIATHDLEFVEEICSRAIVLDSGRVVADGPIMDILGDEPLMRRHGLSRY